MSACKTNARTRGARRCAPTLPFRSHLAIFGVVLLVLAGGFACDDTDDGDANGEGPNGSPAADDGNGGENIQERLDELQGRFDGLSEDTQSEIEDLWNETQSTFEDWESASEDEREALQEEFNELAQELDEQIDEVSEDAGDDDNGNAE